MKNGLGVVSLSDQCPAGLALASFTFRAAIREQQAASEISISVQKVSIYARNNACVWICCPIQAMACDRMRCPAANSAKGQKQT